MLSTSRPDGCQLTFSTSHDYVCPVILVFRCRLCRERLFLGHYTLDDVLSDHFSFYCCRNAPIFPCDCRWMMWYIWSMDADILTCFEYCFDRDPQYCHYGSVAGRCICAVDFNCQEVLMSLTIIAISQLSFVGSFQSSI